MNETLRPSERMLKEMLEAEDRILTRIKQGFINFGNDSWVVENILSITDDLCRERKQP
jgi:hypothetical protein